MDDLKQKFKRLVLIFGDILFLYLSLFIALKLRYGTDYNPEVFWLHFYPFSIIYAFWIFVFYINNLYSINYAQNTYSFYALIIKSSLFNAVISALLFYFAFSSLGISPKTVLLFDILIFAAFFAIWRVFYNYFIKAKAFSINTLILSDEPEAAEIIEKISANPQLGYNICHLDFPNCHPELACPVANLCSATGVSGSNQINLKNFIAANNIKLIITSEKAKNDPALMQKLYELLPLKIKFENLPGVYEQITGKIPISIIGRIWFLENIKNLDRPFYDIFKRSTDIALSLMLAIPSIILCPFIAGTIKYQDNGPIFYRQKRIGKDGHEFTIIKFRTMNTSSEKDGPKFTERNDNRITKIGKFLRDTRIDELPQIINVLRGEMSFIGPRPERPEFVADFQKQIPYYNFRHIVKPGLTGWAQVNYEYGDSINDAYKKLQYDLYYIKNKSLILDIDTALKTIEIILNRKGR